jgi:hypothetical protein
VAQLLQRLREELVRRDYAAITIRSIRRSLTRAAKQSARVSTESRPPGFDAIACLCWRSVVSRSGGRHADLRPALLLPLRSQAPDMREDLPYPKERHRLPVVLRPTKCSS